MYKAAKRLRKIEIFSVSVWDFVETKTLLLLPIIVKMKKSIKISGSLYKQESVILVWGHGRVNSPNLL